ncbi:MAG: phosphoglucosamine mutase [Deltaproteobacteria bacterium]|nr:phosphoglucosamine mutase [Deltaproteobacteria bacterium]
MKKYFGTDGIRGEFGTFPMTTEIAYKVGYSVATYFIHETQGQNIKIALARDTRESGKELELALHQGLLAGGAHPHHAGILPTPSMCLITYIQDFDAAIVISASHNPYQDNGLKIFGPQGKKINDDAEIQIEELIEASHLPKKGLRVTETFPTDDGIKKIYLEFLRGSIKPYHLSDFKIVLDCAHGATYSIAPQVFRNVGAEVVAINIEPDGHNINENSGALYPENLSKKVLEENATLGCAFDGDGDRLILVDEKGNIVDGADILAAWAVYLKNKNLLKKDTLVSTSMCNYGIDKSLEPYGIHIVRTDVGDRYILEEMLKEDYNLGGEPSGHLIYKDLIPTGDGILSALQVCKMLKEENKTLSELVSFIKKFPQILRSFSVKEKRPFSEIPHFKEVYEKAEEKLGKWGRLVVRYSGTENLARVMAEGEDSQIVENVVEDLTHIIQKNSGV